jgi:hypothetical protein
VSPEAVRTSNVGPGVDQSGVGDATGSATAVAGDGDETTSGVVFAAAASIVCMIDAAVASRAGPNGSRGKLQAKADVMRTMRARRANGRLGMMLAADGRRGQG